MQLEDFGRKGLRTLVFARKDIEVDEFEEFKTKHNVTR